MRERPVPGAARPGREGNKRTRPRQHSAEQAQARRGAHSHGGHAPVGAAEVRPGLGEAGVACRRGVREGARSGGRWKAGLRRGRLPACALGLRSLLRSLLHPAGGGGSRSSPWGFQETSRVAMLGLSAMASLSASRATPAQRQEGLAGRVSSAGATVAGCASSRCAKLVGGACAAVLDSECYSRSALSPSDMALRAPWAWARATSVARRRRHFMPVCVV